MKQATDKGKAIQNPYLFIVGCARSGTTLLQRIVNAHSQIAITPEIHWITNHFKKRGAGLTTGGLVTAELVSLWLDHKRFPQLEISRAEFECLLDSSKSLRYADFLTEIFELYGKSKGKRLVGNKTPAYLRNIPTLHALWPDAKFVHLIRDGRDVCLSIMNWKKTGNKVGSYATWKEDPVSTIALWWKRNVLLGRETGRELSEDLYYEIRYESLVASPANECKSLCTFLGVPYDDAMLRFYDDRTRTGFERSDERARLPITPGLREWRSQMGVEDVERFEAAAGDLLSELGYACMFQGPSSAKLKRAAMIHELFTQDIRLRERLLPKKWSVR